ncbi:MAG: hypothetical protein ACLFPX_07155 [Candidatus Omnitrophota bacterium]
MFRTLKHKKRKGQSTLEYAVLIIIVIGALLAIQNYVKRGIQGRLRQATDDIGSQYEVGAMNVTRKTSTWSKTKETFDEGVMNTALLCDEVTNVEYNEEYVGEATYGGYWGETE